MVGLAVRSKNDSVLVSHETATFARPTGLREHKILHPKMERRSINVEGKGLAPPPHDPVGGYREGV